MESLQWNFDVKVYEIDSIFYVFVYAQISFLSHIHKKYLMQIYETSYEVWTFRDIYS